MIYCNRFGTSVMLAEKEMPKSSGLLDLFLVHFQSWECLTMSRAGLLRVWQPLERHFEVHHTFASVTPVNLIYIFYFLLISWKIQLIYMKIGKIGYITKVIPLWLHKKITKSSGRKKQYNLSLFKSLLCYNYIWKCVSIRYYMYKICKLL